MKASRLIAGLVVVALVATVVFAVTQSLAQDDGSTNDRRATRRRRWRPTPTPEPGSSEPPEADLASFYGQELTWESCRGRVRVRDADGADRLPGPGRRDDRARRCSRTRPTIPGRADRLAGRQPRRPGRARHVATPRTRRWRSATCSATTSTSSASTRAAPATPMPVDCISDADLDALPGRPTPTRTRPRRRSEFQASQRELLPRAAMQNSDSLISHVTTIEAARDMDVLRAALGESQMLTYFGASYGTKLGRDVRRPVPRQGRPDGARRSGRPLHRPAAAQPRAGRRLRGRRCASYVQNCVDEGDCFLGDTRRRRAATDPGPDRRASTRSRCRPRSATATLRGAATRSTAWSRRSTTATTGRSSTRRCETALDGDGTLLLLLSDFYESRNDDGTYSDNSAEAILAINCLDDPYSITADEVPDQIPAFEEASPTFGEVFAWGLVSCHGVQAAGHRDGRRRSTRRAPPRSWCRHDPRPRDAVPVGRAPRRPAGVRRAGQPRRRRAHRLQLGQRVRRRGGRGLPRRRHRAAGRAGVLTS